MKTSPGIKTLVLIVSLLLLIPICKNWYSFLARSFSDDADTSVNPLEYKILTGSTAAVSKCRLPEIENICIPEKVLINGNDYTVTHIGNKAFSYCRKLTNVKIPTSVTEIEYSAFSGCSSLTNIEIPKNVTDIGKWAFMNCFSLANIEIPENITFIEIGTFYGCSHLTNIEIPTSVTRIEEWAFSNCSKLRDIKIPASVTKIGDHAFDGCDKIDVVIDKTKNDIDIGYHAFLGCRSVRYAE